MKIEDIKFVHIPKTGGYSITVYLLSIGYSQKKQNHNFGKLCDDKFKFAIVRNPWDRLVSVYHFMSNDPKNDLPCHEYELFKSFDVRSFDEFIKYIYDNIFIKGNYELLINGDKSYFTNQTKWVLDDKNNIIVDYIGRFEVFNKSIDEINKLTGLKIIVDKLNKSNHDNYTKYYTDETKEMVEEMYKEDIDYFGYTFK